VFFPGKGGAQEKSVEIVLLIDWFSSGLYDIKTNVDKDRTC